VSSELKKTPLHGHHAAMGARMTAFAGYEMPIQFPDGVLSEHRWTRAQAGVFDVSHMGPSFLTLANPSGDPDQDHRRLAALIEPLVSADVASLAPGRVRYAVLLNEAGGMVDDLMIARLPDAAPQRGLYVVVNGATKDGDFAMMAAAAGDAGRLRRSDDDALIAVQGPEAAAVVEAALPGAADLGFMTCGLRTFQDETLVVSRSGYTGEDGFEILAPKAVASRFYHVLIQDRRVKPIGLGARDSLRLEAGLPLYGHDADETVSPVEAGLAFAISKRRLKAGEVRGGARLTEELEGGLDRIRIGLRILEGAPAREGAVIADNTGRPVGRVTSGGFSPTLSYPIAMGFAPPALSQPGLRLNVIVRGKAQAAEVTSMPFVPHRYVRKP